MFSKYPDAFLVERAKRFNVSINGIFEALQRLGVTYKKTLKHPKADEEKRSLFQKKIKTYESQGLQIVYLDESGFALDSPRLRGYSSKGKRCFGTINWNAKGRVNAIGALLGTALIAVSLYACNVDSDVFLHWVENDLLAHAPPSSVIVLDNATFHKCNDIKARIIG
jgi:hypothetical protein